MGVAMNVEGGELQVTLGGLFRDYPPDDETGFLAFAESLENTELFRTIRQATPVSPIVTHRFPSHLWTRYDRLQSLPINLLVVGDAMCSFNPIYGQGMSVAALEAQALHGCLTEFQRSPGDFRRMRDGYFRRATSAVKAAWVMATGADLSYPQAAEFREPGHAVVNRYIGQVIALSCYDKRALITWNQVTNMQRPLSALFAVPLIGRVIGRLASGGPVLPVHEPIRA
jgi:2-polyprenyl-6-methoxyphenol hydroxylase-like FAD-dependent oxidoreductase